MLRAAAMFTTACTITDEPSISAMSLTKQRSILILSNGKRLQIAQRGKAGAEIVERDAHADGAELMQDRERGLVVADQHGLGDFEFEPVRARPEAASAPAIRSASVGAFELDRRDVDREPDMRRPGRGLGAGGAQHPFAELVDQAGVLRDRDEFGRRDHAAFGMAPAQQRLAAGHLVAARSTSGW